ncbi:MAG: Crp/Fnr family transcriptional regulator [Candidatus Tectomicrobia bacterium]|nr:Crp/Fnr family transcriptional regulator [Candidatus Tectomicrobia bacterium]
MKILLPSPEGENVIVALLSTGEFFGELSLFDGAPRSATAAAAESTEILTLDKDDFNRYILENPKAALTFLAELSLRLRHTDELLSDAAFCNLATRLAKRLMELAHRYGQPGPNGSIRINMKLKQQDLADMSGATRESVNKVLKMFKAQRLIHWSKGIISLLDPAIMRRKAR